MFKKLKDKLAEEVKSSPQRIHQIAQAAQAAVTSASSSISDITNSDLFSIGDNDGQSGKTIKPSTSNSHPAMFQDVSFSQSSSFVGADSMDVSGHDIMENQRQRRLSNSSLASDVSFRLPSYESPSMYHLQSDMDVSASEADERGFSTGAVSLDRVTKEQLYAAYRRTQERYTKYRTQYADLARHYKLLERENAKARSVLVETQDKALRRISELREQCSLEQSAKAHLEKALRVEIDERNMKIEALNTQVSLLQNNFQFSNDNEKSQPNSSNKMQTEVSDKENEVQLINLSTENDSKPPSEETTTNDGVLHSKIEKMEQLLNKYKESVKSIKEKNSQMTAELQILSSELDNKKKENEQLQDNVAQLSTSQQKIQELNNVIEELQNTINTYDFSKSKEISSLEIDLQKSREEAAQLQSKMDKFSKREEEYAISLAENKLSIHKELEGKESEIKSLKDSLSAAKKEIQSLNVILDEYKSNITTLEVEISKLNSELKESSTDKSKVMDMETQIRILTQKCQSFEQFKAKDDEELKCLQLQMNQETAEKLAMVDRNTYLENRISHLTEENSKKSTQITQLEKELLSMTNKEQDSTEKLNEIEFWKSKYSSLENEIQEEREELIKLQAEIEKLLTNHEAVQNQNIQLHDDLSTLKSKNRLLCQNQDSIKHKSENLQAAAKVLRNDIKSLTELIQLFKQEFKNNMVPEIISKIYTLNKCSDENMKVKYDKLEKDFLTMETDFKKKCENHTALSREVGILNSENKSLADKIQDYESQIVSQQKEIETLTNKVTHISNDTNLLKNEKQILIKKLQEVETLYNCLQDNVDHDKSQYLTALDKLKLIEDEKQTLLKRLKNIEKENESLNIETEKLKVLHKDDISRLNSIAKEKQTLYKELEDKEAAVLNLDQTLIILSTENITLKNQTESIANSFKSLEQELDEVRKSHNEIETEKDRLNSIIDVLEKKELENSVSSSDDKNTQTDYELQTPNVEDEHAEKSFAVLENNNVQFSEPKTGDEVLTLLENIEVLTSKNTIFEEEINSLKEINLSLSNKYDEVNEQLNSSKIENNIEENELLKEKYRTLISDNEILKDDNRRLQSDIEGLQTYLTKISKENGSLNDKLREVMATSESFAGNSAFDTPDSDSSELQKEVVSGKEKIEDLIRENTLLVEENLELKDQLQTQLYIEPKKISKQSGNDSISVEKYNNLLINKNKLEEKLLEMEQMNKSIDGNMQLTQSSNEKLKLNNEKLERRLDEALVSLRHLHSLQENTELEYLRNVLYEYLTGTGTHSITLAKVLAAVVKFDDKQTQHVLQKEKERQGVLRQLGLL